MLTFLRVFVVVAVVGVLASGVALVQALVSPVTDTPRTAAERTIMSAEEAVRANPDDAIARARLAAAYLQQGSAGMAKEQAELALRLDPELPDAYFVLGVANYRTGEYEAAVQDLVTASETEGQFATFYMEVFMALADAHEALGDYESALAAYSEAIKRAPTNALIYIERGLMFERQEQWYDAAADFAYALVFIDDNQEALDGLARIEQSSPEEYARARQDIDAVRAQLVPHSQVDTPTAE